MPQTGTALLYSFACFILSTQASPLQPDLLGRSSNVCNSGLYADLSFLSAYPLAQSYCTANYPVSCTSKAKVRRVTASCVTCSTNIMTKTTDPTSSAWSKCLAQGGGFVATFCTCIETSKPCATTSSATSKTSTSKPASTSATTSNTTKPTSLTKTTSTTSPKTPNPTPNPPPSGPTANPPPPGPTANPPPPGPTNTPPNPTKTTSLTSNTTSKPTTSSTSTTSPTGTTISTSTTSPTGTTISTGTTSLTGTTSTTATLSCPATTAQLATCSPSVTGGAGALANYYTRVYQGVGKHAGSPAGTLSSAITASDDCSAIQSCANTAAVAVDNGFEVYYVLSSQNYMCVRFSQLASQSDIAFGSVADCNVGADYGYYAGTPPGTSSAANPTKR